MKVLHIFDHSIPLHSGYTFRSRAILQHQRNRGWDTCHVTSIKHRAASPGEEVVDGLKFYRTPHSYGVIRKIPVLNQLEVISTLRKRLDQIIAIEKPDLIQAHSPALNGIAAILSGRRHGLPVVYECRAFWEDAAVDHGTSRERGPRYALTRHLETYAFRHADAITTICDGLKRDIVSRGIAEQKVTVIPNAVDIDKFIVSNEKNVRLLQALELENSTVLGFIGSFYAYEGLALLIRSMPEILRQAADTRLLLVGGGPQYQQIVDLVKQLNLEHVVKFTGRVPHEEVGEYYGLVDIFVYPRLSMRLTDLVTPLKPLEAMAQGKLVLASDVGGHKELINDRVNGRLFESGSIDSLVSTALDLMRHKPQWACYRHAGRAFVEAERNWSVSVARYQPVFSSLLGN